MHVSLCFQRRVFILFLEFSYSCQTCTKCFHCPLQTPVGMLCSCQSCALLQTIFTCPCQIQQSVLKIWCGYGSTAVNVKTIHRRTNSESKTAAIKNISLHWTVQAPNVNCYANSNRTKTKPRFLSQWLMRIHDKFFTFVWLLQLGLCFQTVHCDDTI